MIFFLKWEFLKKKFPLPLHSPLQISKLHKKKKKNPGNFHGVESLFLVLSRAFVEVCVANH